MTTLCETLQRSALQALFVTPLLLSSTYALAENTISVEALAPIETTKASETAPPYTLTYNLGIYSAYQYRGNNLSDGPALQGGIDWTHNSGFYLGTWFSTIDPLYSGESDVLGTKGNHVENDFYAGYFHTFESGFGVNFLGNYYKYWEGRKANNVLPSGDIRKHRQDSFEVSAALTYKWFTYTYYRTLTDYFGADETDKNFNITGNRNTDGADYHELRLNYKLPIADLNFMTKVGYVRTPNLQGNQGDFAIGLNRDFSMPTGGKPLEGFNAGAVYTSTFSVKNEDFYLTTDGRDVNEDYMWFYIKRTW